MAKFKRGSLTLARQVFNTPQLILADDLQNIAQYLVNRANGIEVELDSATAEPVEKELRTQFTEQEQKERNWRRLGITNEGRRGNLEVTGTLVAKAGNIDADCMELTSYESLYEKFSQQVSEGVQELVLHVDSGGGSAFSCFEMATQVKNLATEKGIKIYAYIDGFSASAAYAWTSIADEVIARPDSEVGSVGVVVQLINNSKMLENIGITRQFVCHGEQKVPFTADGDFSPQFISSIQKKVDKTGMEFSSFIAKNRNMTVEAVLATQAEVFDTEDALAVGFIDKIMTKSEFFGNYLPSQSGSNGVYDFQGGMAADNSQKQKEVTMSEDSANQKEVKSGELLSNTHVTENPTGTENMSQDSQVQMSELQEQFQELTGKYEGVVEKLAASEILNKELQSGIEERELSALVAKRTTQLESALGKDNENVAKLLASTSTLAEEDFNNVVSGLSSTQDEDQSQFLELGGEGQEAEVQLDLSQQLKQMAASMNKNRKA